MTSEEYQALMGKVNLSEEQKTLLCDLIEELGNGAYGHAIRLGRVGDIGDWTRGFYNGKASGLNLAWKIIYGSADEDDSLEPDYDSLKERLEKL